ncbi:MAG: hypothetical protein R8G66_13580 [Cytophagales bacterium]|nr:hypothetical protein [Cytophagales bacterium]
MKNYFRMISVYLVSITFLASCTALTDDLSEITNGIPPDTGDRTTYGNNSGDQAGEAPNDANGIGVGNGLRRSTAPVPFNASNKNSESPYSGEDLNSTKITPGSDHGDDDGIPPDNALSKSSDQEVEYGYWGRDMHDINGIPPDNITSSAAGNFGRAHGDSDGIPPDGQIRTNWGTYPSGGLFDENEESSTDEGSGN